MPFVVDASISAVWALSAETSGIAEFAYRQLYSDRAFVPPHWWFEVCNTLIVNERRGRLRESETAMFLQALAMLPITRDLNPEESAVLHLARVHKLTVYEAAYLELAKRQGAPLATLDVELARAARAERIALVGNRK